MDLILLRKVANLGDLGDQVSVKSGFGRNYLIPNGYAVRASKENIEHFESRRAEFEQRAQDALALASGRKAALEGLVVTIEVAVDAGGKLYGSVGPAEIAEAVTAKGVELNKSEVRMPEGPKRETGEYGIDLHLHADVDAVITLRVADQDNPDAVLTKPGSDDSADEPAVEIADQDEEQAA